ncbi:5338_t:CDS:1, partial [Racocetra persica]
YYAMLLILKMNDQNNDNNLISFLMSRHRLLQFDKVETSQFRLRAPKISRNLSSNNNEDTLTNLHSPSLQNDSNSEQSSCSNFNIVENFNNDDLQSGYDESNNDNLDLDNIQYENESYDTNLESQDDIETILTDTDSSSEIFDDTNYLLWNQECQFGAFENFTTMAMF